MPVATVTHTEPFHVSKAIATLDYVSHGRAGWQPRVSSTAHEAALFGRRDVAGVDLFAEAVDYVEVVRRLWDSWEDDAIIRDVATGRYVDVDKLHYVDFVGKFFSVKGPSITPRPPQGQPVVAALAHLGPVYEFAAASADLVFITPKDDSSLRGILGEVVAAGGSGLKVFADVVVSFGGDGDPARRAEFHRNTIGSGGPAGGLAAPRHSRRPAAAGRQRHRSAGDRRQGGTAVAAGRPLPHRLPGRRDAALSARLTGGAQPLCGGEPMNAPLSVLDLAPISAGSDAATALRNTIELAQRAEAWGFRRYWVAEHHFVAVASAAPAVLIGQIASATNTIQVGAAAVQLGYTTAIAVVESFGMLEAFYPGRIDLGVGRSGQRHAEQHKPKKPREPRPPRVWHEVDGVVIPTPFDLRGRLDLEQVQATMGLLQQPEAVSPDFAEQVDDILALLDGTYRAGNCDVHAVPGKEADCGPGSLAAPAAKAHAWPGRGVTVRRELPHHAGDRPGSDRGLPRHVRAVGGAAAALRGGVGGYRGRRRHRHRQTAGRRVRSLGLFDPNGCRRHALPEARRLPAADRRPAGLGKDRVATQFVGNAGEVAERLQALQRVTGADELVITSVTHRHQDRLRSHELIAREWGLTG